MISNGDSKRIAALDGLRGVAICMVLWQHLAKPFLPLDGGWAWLRSLTDLSWAGVDVFFVLSGYFIGGILIDHRRSPRLGRVFYLRRALRILPLYYLTLVVIPTLVAGPMPGASHLFPFPVYLFFGTNFALVWADAWDWLPLSILWSLAVEEQFYLLGPWVVRVLVPRWLPWFAVGTALGVWAVRAALLLVYPEGYFAAHMLMPFRMDGFALGGWVAWAVRDEAARTFLRRTWMGHRAAVIGGMILAAVAMIQLGWTRPASGAPSLCFYGYTLIAGFSAVVIAMVAIGESPLLLRLLGVRPLVHLGRHAYFIYLMHPLVNFGLTTIRGSGQPGAAVLQNISLGVATLGLTWSLAALSWKWFEGPLVRAGHAHAY